MENGITKGAREAVQAACGEGHLSVAQWLLERGDVQYPHFAMNCANFSRSPGHCTFLEKYDTGLFPAVDPSRVGQSNQTAIDRATNNGHFHVLEFLHSVAVQMQKEGRSERPTCTNWAQPDSPDDEASPTMASSSGESG
ncbi:Ankyrin repeat-containing domain [Phytophthora cactorum]|nr:Ankyrin repeat-containing domain [Phytophthora cactorum]